MVRVGSCATKLLKNNKNIEGPIGSFLIGFRVVFIQVISYF